MDAGTGVNLPGEAPPGARAITTTSAGRGGRTDGAETAVDPIAEVKLRPFHETQDTLLPFYGVTRGLNVQASINGSAGVKNYSFRLNSPYDVVNTGTYTADPTPAADTADALIQKTQMYDYWSSIYRYWHVTKSTYEITFWAETKHDTAGLSIWCYHHGQQEPPILNTAGNIIPDYIRQLHKHCHMQVLYPRGTGTSDHERKTAVTFTGTYVPGQKSVHNDVAEDEYQETWHRVNEVPSLREVVSFIIQKNDSCTETDVVVHMEYKLFYHVQWKDQLVIYQYPTQLSDTVAVTDYADRDI
jgi:hypothetical protein